MTVCYIGMGSNLCQPLQQLSEAKTAIQNVAQITLVSCSSLYQSEAVTLPAVSGGLQNEPPQADYLNGVLKIETQLSAEDLLDVLQGIENAQGRTREKRWGARTLDLDILLYGEQKINTRRLTVPHVEMLNRNFVLTPLLQLAADLNMDIFMQTGKSHCASKTLKECMGHVSHQRVTQVGEIA
ncbi:2-amino-4-hydroxy-6-hydroxymethyldihydropteridinepyrophosphokinase [hydrothermal vent metagenome]|uniref:2-amino-4-hydroxy-6-hydroxymethyldihydropteridine diphosphokinase n=1 Tax=hydrothermal vent metagenome TaxID=652676 RepID=A0A3B0WPY4_9ZZZZ